MVRIARASDAHARRTPINRGEEADNVASRKEYLASLPAAITA